MARPQSFRRWLCSLGISLLMMAGSIAGVAAQDEGDAVAGRQLAENWCSSCHIVGPGQRRGTSTGAPTFTSIASHKEITRMALLVFLQTPHDRMPDLHLSRHEIDDVSAYILSLRRR